jgi:hypothetical protein
VHKAFEQFQQCVTVGMRIDDLSREQAEALQAKQTPMLRYLNRRQERMIKRGFPRRVSPVDMTTSD